MQARFRTAATLGCLATCVLVTLGLGGPAAAAEGEDVLQLTALTGPAGGDLTITVPASAGGSDVDMFEHVQIQLIAPAASDEKPNRIINLKAVDARRGSATIDLGPLERGTAVDVQLHARELKPPTTRILRGDGIAKLRPDLVVAAVHAPRADALDATDRRRRGHRRAQRRYRSDRDADADARPDAARRAEDGDGAAGRLARARRSRT